MIPIIPHRAIAPAVASLVLACTPALAAGRSIVGEWAPNPRMCRPMDGALKIVPLGMAGDEFSCDFKSVSRVGDVVTWRGSCGFPRSRELQPSSQHCVERSSVRINGNGIGSYQRCRPGSGVQG